jgi:nicotinamidase-related amidase
MASKVKRFGRLLNGNSSLFVCDLQEKFRHSIQHFPAIAQVCSRLLDTAQILNIPTIVTEQYPKGLGKTVEEIGLAKYPQLIPHEKTQFSMCVPPVLEDLKSRHIQHVILCGIGTIALLSARQGQCLH